MVEELACALAEALGVAVQGLGWGWRREGHGLLYLVGCALCYRHSCHQRLKRDCPVFVWERWRRETSEPLQFAGET